MHLHPYPSRPSASQTNPEGRQNNKRKKDRERECMSILTPRHFNAQHANFHMSSKNSGIRLTFGPVETPALNTDRNTTRPKPTQTTSDTVVRRHKNLKGKGVGSNDHESDTDKERPETNGKRGNESAHAVDPYLHSLA